MREFDTGATRDTDEDKFDYEGFICPLALERYAAYMHAHRKQADGKMRDSDNWQKGLPISQCVKSLIRHVMDLWKLARKYIVSDPKDGHFISMEEACCGILFNTFSILSTLQKKKVKKFEQDYEMIYESTPRQEGKSRYREFMDKKVTILHDKDTPKGVSPAEWEKAKDGDAVPYDPYLLGAPEDKERTHTPEELVKLQERAGRSSGLCAPSSFPPTQHGGDE